MSYARITAETDNECRSSHQRIGSKEHQIRPIRASSFEFRVQEKRGFSAASLLPHSPDHGFDLKAAGAKSACQFPVQIREGITSRTAALDWPQERTTGGNVGFFIERVVDAQNHRSVAGFMQSSSLQGAECRKSVIAVSEGWLQRASR